MPVSEDPFRKLARPCPHCGGTSQKPLSRTILVYAPAVGVRMECELVKPGWEAVDTRSMSRSHGESDASGRRPGWLPPASGSVATPSVSVWAPVTPPGVSAPAETRADPDAAVRARLNAAIIDAIVIGAVTRALVSLLGVATSSGDAILLVLGVQFLYFFALELRTGQTIGKRAMHVRVVALDGSPATTRMCAIRNAMRFVDALPLLYASGLLSLIRTGRARRQRIGDVVAGTTVIVQSGGKPLRTPRWLLPTAAVLATVVSVGVIVAARRAERRATGLSQLVATGWAGDNSQPPAPGSWQAIGTTTFSKGYGSEVAGQQLARAWQISRTCGPNDCSISLTRQVAGGAPQTAQLIPKPDGWHATFPDQTYVCGQVGGQVITWQQHSTWVLRFANQGMLAEAHERNVSFAPACGWGTDTLDWIGHHS